MLKIVSTSQRVQIIQGTSYVYEDFSYRDVDKKQTQQRAEKECLAYDTTSISSYSELIAHVRYGKNKDGDSLPQVNLALIFGQHSMLPVYFWKLPGNITDVNTVCKLLKDLDYMSLKIRMIT